MSEGVIRVKSWEEFKRLVNEQKPSSVVYVIEQSGLSPNRELTSLRLMFPSSKAYYVFLDFAKGETLRETRIPLSKDKQGNYFIEEENVKNFLKKQLGNENLTICAYWTI
ncbi:MAG: hypothetical protein NWE99_09010 [Candidatus Bathyarchaeota archaeon]|nr:hypothetical protein [Candidatus Bathyarchaeota archaeon]